MLGPEQKAILESSRGAGWVLEPEAKRLLALAGLQVPRFRWVRTLEEARRSAAEIGYPVVAKVVSPEIVHKSDSGGVVAGIPGEAALTRSFERLSGLKGFDGLLVEEMLSGLELIVGAKIDYQFGPVVLLGMGGTAVEIYRDTALRMAPLGRRDAESMMKALKARSLLDGYRGSEPVDPQALTRLLTRFSELVMELAEEIDSMDLNPVICSGERCVVADARIMLKGVA